MNEDTLKKFMNEELEESTEPLTPNDYLELFETKVENYVVAVNSLLERLSEPRRPFGATVISFRHIGMEVESLSSKPTLLTDQLVDEFVLERFRKKGWIITRIDGGLGKSREVAWNFETPVNVQRRLEIH